MDVWAAAERAEVGVWRAPVTAPQLISGVLIALPRGLSWQDEERAMAHELAHHALGHGLAGFLRLVGAHRLARRQEWREEYEARAYVARTWPEHAA